MKILYVDNIISLFTDDEGESSDDLDAVTEQKNRY